MSHSENSSSGDKSISPLVASPQSTGSRTTTSLPSNAIEPQAPSCGWPSTRSATRLPRRPGTHSPSPARTPADSPASSCWSTRPVFPPIEKWTMASLRQALTNSDIQAPRKFTKAELYDFSFLSRLLPQRYRGPPPKRASGRLRHQSRPRCPPLSAQSPQSKQAFGHNGRLTQPHHPPLSAQGLQPKHVFGRTGSHTQPRSPPLSNRGLQPMQALGRCGLPTHEPRSPAGCRREHSRPDNLTFSSLMLGDAYPSDTLDAGESLPTTQLDLFRLYLSDTVSIDLPMDVSESLPARQTYLFKSLAWQAYLSDTASIDLPTDVSKSLPDRQTCLFCLFAPPYQPLSNATYPRRWPIKQVSTLTSWMTAKRPDQTLPFHLYLFDTVSLDLPSDAGESLPARQPYLFKSHAGDAYISDTVGIVLSSGDSNSLPARRFTASSYGRTRLTRSTQ
ncbi:hypothetical protein G5714_000715 [Onychostoma macrolepis]|uniref:Uncharacterized protein n=1 Tax=Onychostoma macrolepis TaxID=369639 RepID=A0A7J6DIN0_9TELE|nr:hypothetical protein G5714_000715 [Onychostoma macrolepis]